MNNQLIILFLVALNIASNIHSVHSACHQSSQSSMQTLANEPRVKDVCSAANCCSMLTIHADDDGTVLLRVDSSVSRGVDVVSAVVIAMEWSRSSWVDKLDIKGTTSPFWLLWLTSEASETGRLPSTETKAWSDSGQKVLPSLIWSWFTDENGASLRFPDAESITKCDSWLVEHGPDVASVSLHISEVELGFETSTVGGDDCCTIGHGCNEECGCGVPNVESIISTSLRVSPSLLSMLLRSMWDTHDQSHGDTLVLLWAWWGGPDGIKV